MGTYLDNLLNGLGMNFDVAKVALHAYVPKGNVTEQVMWPHNMAVMRTDTKQLIACVGSNYACVPYGRSLSVIEPLILSGKVILRKGNMTRNGARIFLYFITEDVFQAQDGLDGSTFQCGFFLNSSHDGSCEVEVVMAPYHGTYGHMPFGKVMNWRHRQNIEQRLAAAKDTFNTIREEFSAFEEGAKLMLRRRLSDEGARAYLEDVFGEPTTDARASTQDELLIQWKHGSSIPAANGTLFGLYLTVINKINTSKSRGGSRTSEEDSRLESFVRGTAARAKANAYAVALRFLGGE